LQYFNYINQRIPVPSNPPVRGHRRREREEEDCFYFFVLAHFEGIDWGNVNTKGMDFTSVSGRFTDGKNPITAGAVGMVGAGAKDGTN
jgi:hypothetical protein